MSEQFIKDMRTAIKNTVDDSEYQKKKQLEQEQQTLKGNVQQLQDELNTLISNHDFQGAETKETELISAKKQLKMVTDVLNAYGDDVNLYEVDYDELQSIERQVHNHFRSKIKTQCEALETLLNQAEAIQDQIKQVNAEANGLFQFILSAKKDRLTPRSAMDWNHMQEGTKEAEALKRLRTFTSEFLK